MTTMMRSVSACTGGPLRSDRQLPTIRAVALCTLWKSQTNCLEELTITITATSTLSRIPLRKIGEEVTPITKGMDKQNGVPMQLMPLGPVRVNIREKEKVRDLKEGALIVVDRTLPETALMALREAQRVVRQV